MNLRQNGFMYAFNAGEEPWQGNSIPYREDQHQDRDGLVYYLAEQWLGRDWVHIGQLLRNIIVGTAWEIYANAFEHGQTDIGVFSCGQHYPKLGELRLTVVDFGVGIPDNVRVFLENRDLPADKALKWAFQKGTTTRRGSVTGGIGLDCLKRFVKINKGKLEIFSHDGYVAIDENQETYQNRQTFFGGTLVNITLKCDESYYSLVFETDDKPLF
jgi:signal transduction histidine kinase